MTRSNFIFTITLLVVFFSTSLFAQEIVCKNPNRKTYNKNPAFCSPEDTRGKGISIIINTVKQPIPDLRCACLPIALRYNNPGVLKTPSGGGWKWQMKDGNGTPVKDIKGHAVFASVENGISAWGEWIKRRIATSHIENAFQIMSIYAPPDDCVGSIGIFPNCPLGPNPTLEYATKVAKAVGKGPRDKLNLDGTRRKGRSSLFSIFTAIANFEIGSDFCKGKCEISRETFEKAMDAAWGAVRD